MPVVAARITDVQREEEAFQGHRLLEIQVTDEASQQMLPAGTIVVRTQQDLGRLAILLLEPMSQDGLVSWNFFDQALAVDELFPVLTDRTHVAFAVAGATGRGMRFGMVEVLLNRCMA